MHGNQVRGLPQLVRFLLVDPLPGAVGVAAAAREQTLPQPEEVEISACQLRTPEKPPPQNRSKSDINSVPDLLHPEHNLRLPAVANVP